MSYKIALVALNEQTVPAFVTETLARASIELVIHECTTRAELEQCAGDADIVWSFGDCVALTAENLDVMPRCGAIIRSGSGTDAIPVASATARGIVVINTPAAVSDAVSDHTIGLLFAVMRQIPARDRAVRAGKWERNLPALRWHLLDQTLGLIGFGFIGQTVASKLKGFNLRVIVFDPYAKPDVLTRLNVESVPLNDVLRQSDFISIHCALTPETRHLIGERELRLMKPNAILINTARGGIIDQAALLRALQEKWIGGAGLDVVDPEPPQFDDPLLQLDNVVVTPHIGGYADNSLERAWRFSLESALDLARGRLPQSVVNRDVKPRWSLK